ncbi:MAG: hypothetical protein J6U54_17705 [Clostridiales bacterium]|nr:hypothetical protein [Clostridiales bacterium]
MVTPPVPGSFMPKQSDKIDIVDVKPKSHGWRRIREVFIAEDLGTVKGKVFEGVVVPSIKDFIVNVVTNTVTMIFYGEKAVVNKGIQSSWLGGSGKRVSYSSYYASSLNGDISKKLSPDMVTSYAEPLFSTFEEAKDCLSDLVEMLDNYPQVTVSDLYSHETVVKNGYRNEAVFNKWGWKNLGNAHVSATPNGYTLNLPKPKHLED